MEKITGAKAWIWALAILVGVGGVVYGVYQHDRAETYKGYKSALTLELQMHKQDLEAHEAAAKTCDRRSKADRKTIEELMKQRDRIAKKLWIGKGANVTINVAP